MTDTATEELERLLAAADFTEPLTVNYTELGRLDDPKLYAFLMEGDPDDGAHVAVDEEPTGTDVPSPRLEAIAALVNAAPSLIADWKAQKVCIEQLSLGVFRQETGADDDLLDSDTNLLLADWKRLKAERDAMAEALKLAKMAINCVYEFEDDPSCCGEHLEAADEAVNSALGTHHNEALESSK